MSKFQIILLTVFGVAIVVAVAVFSLYRGAANNIATITIWGDITSTDFYSLLNTPTLSRDRTLSVNYVDKSNKDIDAEFTEALARGTGPDLVLITQDKFWKYKPKLVAIPYASLSEADFKNTFVEEGELFLDPTGVYALPFAIDPMVLFYNRDLLSASGHAKPLAYWDEIYDLATDLSKLDSGGNLVSSVMALGEAANIPNAKEILSLLLLQAGTPITGFVGGDLRSMLNYNFDLPIAPGESALNFYTQFSNPARVYYSWNRSLIDAQTHFASGDAAYYLGFASELRVLRSKNPTLNFGITYVPQSRVSGKKITYGKVYGLAISRGSRNPTAAFATARTLISKESSLSLSEILILPSPRRDLLAVKPTDAVFSVFYDAALQSKGWLDPDPVATRNIFREAIESITSGQARTSEALGEASQEIDRLIK